MNREMKKTSKDLLRMEKTYFDSGPNVQDSKETVIMRMLEKPKKPDFKQLPKSECSILLIKHNFYYL